MAESAISADGIRKTYRGAQTPALNGFDLEVPRGMVYGMLGPNGAGKTTAVRILATLMRLDAGRAVVAGHDVSTDAARVRQRIGLVGQYAAVDEILSGRQNLVLFGRLNHLGRARAATRADELLQRFGLAESGGKPVAKYSGGMRRRLDLAASLIVSPEVLFVDEPTTGLDPQGRQEVWSALRELVAGGTTILLTTQYLEEADQLAHRIAMLWHGRVVSEGTPDELKATIGDDWIDLAFADAEQARRVLPAVAAHADGEPRAEEHRISVPVRQRTKALIAISTALAAEGVEPVEVNLRRPTLDEVFLDLHRKQGDKQEVAA
ncbi:ATP-binding cassette domain-containing protein [Catellatospora citrea]|uniref:Daunorubicin resistance protein DrrA family ABC transporter ATP-binding protein n=1 Tax=Catellatospora citrea TaxID=53366 RepID=A0A8J3KIA3_9ACTN|nr:ATP-binding cassette domain-containing protein [Catellatospora citrea]RKE06163.1 ABC-2 type transport system ATP-binding protein [Catellatospora citrea]GIG00502.1 daunorubicin resistance protein DrrA family ABC transporter ATP-binding protein [Catellatospora citrea]